MRKLWKPCGGRVLKFCTLHLTQEAGQILLSFEEKNFWQVTIINAGAPMQVLPLF